MSELQQVVSKVIPNCTYTTTAHYWAPLADEDDDDDDVDAQSGKEVPPQKVNNISNAQVQHDLQSTIMAWIDQRISRHSQSKSGRLQWLLIQAQHQALSNQRKTCPSPDYQARLLSYPMDHQFRRPTQPPSLLNCSHLKQEKRTCYQGCDQICWSALENLPTLTTPQFFTHKEKA
jgi:hypothetical protein